MAFRGVIVLPVGDDSYICATLRLRKFQGKAMSETAPVSVEIGDSVLYQTVGDEIVLLDLTSQEYFGLDSVGADVWRLLMEHRNVAVVAKQLAAIYEVDEQTALGDIELMISDLTAAKLLKTVEQAEL
jgi:Coenzyme PQQ synthesis protein D (PqqD)